MIPDGAALPQRRASPGDELDAVLARGVGEGIITGDQAARLAALGRERADLPQDDERLRFITGFADIFVTIGLGLFLGAAAYLGRGILGAAGGHALVAALAWGLAEFFSRQRRMALPSIVLLAAFAWAGFHALAVVFGSPLGLESGPGGSGLAGSRTGGLVATAAAAAGTLGLALLHYRRFRVPITIAAGMAALIGTAVLLLLAAFPTALEPRIGLLLALSGLATFALAMRFDLSDPERLTRRSDIAFWLHLLAAPLIVHPALSVFVEGGSPSAGAAVTLLGLVLCLSAVALATDRRAILVSGLVYAGIALASLVQQIGPAGALSLTMLTLGAFVLLLSAGWHPLRGAVLRALPRRLARRLPHRIAP